MATIAKLRAEPQAPRVKTLREASKTYAAICDKVDDLSGEASRLDKEARALAEQLRVTTPAREVDSRVAAILGDIDQEASGTRAELRAQHAAVRMRIDDVERALRVLQDRKRDEGHRASVTVCEEVRDEYKALVVGVCEGLMAAHVANQRLFDLIAAFHANDISWLSLIPMQPVNVLGDAYDEESRLGIYLRNAVQSGFIENRDLPKPFRRGA